jgi:hypothetical protein
MLQWQCSQVTFTLWSKGQGFVVAKNGFDIEHGPGDGMTEFESYVWWLPVKDA